MSNNESKKSYRSLAFVGGLVLTVAPLTFAQSTTTQSTTTQTQTAAPPQGSSTSTDNTSTQSSTTMQGSEAAAGEARARTVSNGEKAKIRGVVTRRDADTFTVRDENGVDTVVRLTDTTRVTERKGNPFRRAKDYGVTSILRGLNLEVEGRGDATGQLAADRVKFSNEEFKVARALEARVNPVEGRVGTAENRIGQVEQNSQRLSGQLDELTALSNAARGGAVAAQQSADSAIAGVTATNDRISAIDDYEPQQTAAINFKVGSVVLSPDARTQLDDIAKQAVSAKGYVIEVTGFADATGGLELNRRLSQRRADAVVRYLAENHRIPLRRIITPFGYGEAQAIADNTTRDGRAQNRRVEVKVLVNKGLTQPAPTMTTPNTTGASTGAAATGASSSGVTSN